MKNIIQYLIEFFLHLKYGEIFISKNFSFRFPYFYSLFSKYSKQFVFVTNNEFNYINDKNIFCLKIVVLGFGFGFSKNKLKEKKS